MLERLANGHWGDAKLLEAWDIDPLAEMLLSTIRDAEQAVIRDPAYLRLFGINDRAPLTAGEVWRHLARAVGPSARSADPSVKSAVDTILERGPLSRRILAAVGPAPSRERMALVYRELADCLAAGRMFVGLE